MKKNTYSLLSDNWLFSNNSKSALYPFLFQILNGGQLNSQYQLGSTTVVFSNAANASSTNTLNTTTATPSVAVVNIHHPIFKYDQDCGPQGTQSIMAMLEDWKSNDNIAGVVLNVNSGGGQASGNSEFAEYISNYTKPIEVFTRDIIASAAYYFSAAANKITAHKHADFIGCIGTMYHSINLDGVISKQGGVINEFYADISPEKNLQSRELKKGNPRPLIETVLNPRAEKFHADMKTYRPQLTEKALKGDIFSPENALTEGLIDAIGTLQDVINNVLEAASPTTPNNNSNTNTMSTLNVPLIEAVIGHSFEASETKHGIILTDAQAEALEHALLENKTAIENAESAANTTKDSLEVLKTENASVADAVKAALKTAEVDDAENLNTVQGVEALSHLVAKYGALDATTTTKTLNNPDPISATNVVAGIDISGAMNN